MMTKQQLVKKPELSWLFGLVVSFQIVVVCLCIIFAAIGRTQGWGDVSDATSTDPVAMLALLASLMVSSVIRYGALYLISWSFSHNEALSEKVYMMGFLANALLDVLQAYVLISVIAAPVVDGGFALLIIPFGGFWVLVGTSITAVVVRLVKRSK